MKHIREAILGAKYHTTVFGKHGEVWFQPKLNSYNLPIEYNSTNYCFWLPADDISVYGESEETVKNRILKQLEEMDKTGETLELVKLAVLL